MKNPPPLSAAAGEGAATRKIKTVSQGCATRPVKKRLIDHPKDWLWGIFSFYAKKESGLVRIHPVR
jgi:hypothetical protein